MSYKWLFVGLFMLLGAMSAGIPLAEGSPPKPDDATLSQRVLQTGLSRMGMPTADPGLGYTCADFVAWVMHRVGTKSTEDFGVSGPDSSLNYVWGKLVLQHNAGNPDADFRVVNPGDVFQFRNVHGPKTGGLYKQHTAIVASNLGGGRFIVVDQNVAGQPFVTVDQVDFSAMYSGTIWAYRPVAK